MNTNVEIYNYLNITNRRLGRLYKVSGISNLPEDFVIDKEKIKQRLLLNRMGNDAVMPEFIQSDKKTIKKIFKISLKNCKKILKNRTFFELFDEKFAKELEIYFDMRESLTKLILKDFNDLDFDESEAYQDIFNLNPILGEQLGGLFESKFDEKTQFANLDKIYEVSYLEKIQLFEQEAKKKRKQKETALQTATKKNKESKEKVIDHSAGKEMEKMIQNKKKMQKKQQIEAAKQEIKQKQNKEK